MSDGNMGARINGGNSEYGRKESDFYPTPPDVTYALLNFLKLPELRTVIWEPACGEGHMVKQIEKMGYRVFGTDIQSGFDFLTCVPPGRFNWIITNPPFSISEQFIRRCSDFNVPFALLLKSQYWHAKKRLPLFRNYTPSFILPLTWRPDFCFGKRDGGSPLMDVMWCVWDGRYGGRSMYIPLERPSEEEMVSFI